MGVGVGVGVGGLRGSGCCWCRGEAVKINGRLQRRDWMRGFPESHRFGFRRKKSNSVKNVFNVVLNLVNIKTKIVNVMLF